MTLKFKAKGHEVYMVLATGGLMLVATVNKQMLTPSMVAEEIADGLNKKMGG